VISAKEALTQPSAQLTPEQLEKADTIEKTVEEHVLKFMERRGVDLEIKETDGNIIAELNQRLKAAGYLPQWKPLLQQHRLNAALQTHLGFRLSLAPSDEAYQPQLQ
jgi:hypothetical protein